MSKKLILWQKYQCSLLLIFKNLEKINELAFVHLLILGTLLYFKNSSNKEFILLKDLL